MSPAQGPYADFQLGLWISANSIGNINKDWYRLIITSKAIVYW